MSVRGFDKDQYQLLDFGDGRKLERFAQWIIDRPCPPAEQARKATPEIWQHAHLKFQRKDGIHGQWRLLQSQMQIDFGENGEQFPAWSIDYQDQFKLNLHLSPVGHLGIFAEQAENWHWISQQVKRLQSGLHEPIKVLNLFAYTGGSTLAAAAAGAHVTHIDSAGNMVNRARQNAESSGLSDASIRWIQEDALLFCQRELKRGNQYQGIILDPPSYGHGPKNQIWKIGRHLLPLLELCGELTSQQRGFILLTNHSPDFSSADLEASFADAIFGSCGAGARASRMTLTAESGERLDAGCVVRFP
ncbi:MAG: SAM-dependent methyltransferase [Planctomycetaceae bacterium]|nr:SAM-dependent methyltransferase [Planctomycetaceae bacterium]